MDNRKSTALSQSAMLFQNCLNLFVQCNLLQIIPYKATTSPKNPTATRIPAAAMFVGAAPALLEFEGTGELEAFAVGIGVGVALLVVDIVLLEYDFVIEDVVAVALPVPSASVVRLAATSSETIFGITVAATPATLMTQFCASGARELYHPGKPLALIWLWSMETNDGLLRAAVTVAGTPESLRDKKSVCFIQLSWPIENLVLDFMKGARKEKEPGDARKGVE
jgi:hypothetical protein